MGLLLLDMDGTLVESSLVEEDDKLQPAPGIFTEPVLRPNVLEVISRSAEEGDSFAIVTNQGGVAWGYATPAEAYARIGRTIALLHGFMGRPFSVHVCFAHERATIKRYREGHERRKPSPKMLDEAMGVHGYGFLEVGEPIAGVVMVGDLEADQEAARSAGVDFVPAGTFFEW